MHNTLRCDKRPKQANQGNLLSSPIQKSGLKEEDEQEEDQEEGEEEEGEKEQGR